MSNNNWKLVNTSEVFYNPNLKLSISLEKRSKDNNEITSLPADNAKSSKKISIKSSKKNQQFAEELLKAIGEDLSPNALMAIMTALTKELTQWTIDAQSTDNTVIKFLEKLTAEHKADIINNIENSWFNYSPTIPGYYFWRKYEGAHIHNVKVFEETDGVRTAMAWLCYSITDFTDMTYGGQWKKDFTHT